MFILKAYVGMNKMNSAKNLPPVGIEPRTSYFLPFASMTELTLQVLIEEYLPSLLLVHQLTFGLDFFFSEIRSRWVIPTEFFTNTPQH